MAGLTDSGLETKRLVDVIADLKTSAVPIFQDLVSAGDVVDTSDSTTLGRIIGLLSPALADLWEAVQEVYSAYDINSATGLALDNLGQIVGVPRLGDTATSADMYFQGNVGITIPVGSEVRSHVTGNAYKTQSDIVLVASACEGVGLTIGTISNTTLAINYRPANSSTPYTTISVPITATDSVDAVLQKIANEVNGSYTDFVATIDNSVVYITSSVDFLLFDFSVTTPLSVAKVLISATVEGVNTGAVAEPALAIDTITTPVLGWDKAYNPVSANVGSTRQTDDEYRTILRNAKFQRSTNIIESLYTALYSLDGVDEALILDNDGDTVDEFGNPPHSFLTIVDGGLNTEIAQAIWKNRPAGIKSVGTTEINILDDFGFSRSINFSRPLPKQIYITMKLTTDGSFPVNGEDLIKTALTNYINSLHIHEDVVYSRLYTPINSIPGHRVDYLYIGTAPNPTETDNITVAYNEKASLDPADITFD